MTRAELGLLIDRVKRSTTNRDVLAVCQVAESMAARLTELAKASHPPPSVATMAKPPFNKRDFMRSYMRRYRARLRHTMNRQGTDHEQSTNKE